MRKLTGKVTNLATDAKVLEDGRVEFHYSKEIRMHVVNFHLCAVLIQQ
jgi:hypothetical protein